MKNELKHLLKELYRLETEMLGDKELSLIIEDQISGRKPNYENPKNAEYLNFKEAADLTISIISLVITLLNYFNINPQKRKTPTMEEIVQQNFGEYWNNLDEKGKAELIKFFKNNDQQSAA